MGIGLYSRVFEGGDKDKASIEIYGIVFIVSKSFMGDGIDCDLYTGNTDRIGGEIV
jgi:hypothetical protein